VGANAYTLQFQYVKELRVIGAKSEYQHLSTARDRVTRHMCSCSGGVLHGTHGHYVKNDWCSVKRRGEDTGIGMENANNIF
jgi:hypothetical protein